MAAQDTGQDNGGYLSMDPYAGLSQQGGGSYAMPYKMPGEPGWGTPINGMPYQTNPDGTPWTGGITGQGQSPYGAQQQGGGSYTGDPSDVNGYLQWLAQQPGHDPILDTPGGQQYYAQKIAETGGLNQQNLGYWQNKATLAQYGGAVGAPAGGGPSGYGSGWNTLPSLQDIENSPGIQFALDRAKNTVQNSAAAKGTLLTGGTLKDLADYTTGAALQGYGNLAQLGLNYNQANQGNLLNWAQLGSNASSIGATGSPA